MFKKGLIVINSFNTGESYIKCINRLKEEFSFLNIKIDIKKTIELKTIISENLEMKDLKGYDFVIFYDKDTVYSRIIEKLGIRVFNNSRAIENCDNKILTEIELSMNNINIVKTIPSLLCYSNSTNINNDFVDNVTKQLGFPLVFKESYGSLGKNVYLINNKDELINYILKFKNSSFLLQEYVKESKGKDIRVIVIGNSVIGAMERHNTSDFRSNIGQGGVGKPTKISEELKEISLKVNKILHLDYSGIDIIYKDNKPYVLEVNSNAFFIEFERVTKKNVAKAYANYIYDIIYRFN